MTNKGFTLLEALAVMTITVLLIVAGIPSYLTFQKNNEANGIATALNASLRLARAEALKRGLTIAVCNGDFVTSATPSPTCKNGSNWDEGWVVRTNATPIENLQTFKISGASIVLASTPVVRFNSTGFPQTTYSFRVAPVGCSKGKAIEVNLSGAIEMTTIDCQ